MMPKPSWDEDKGCCDRIRVYFGMPADSNPNEKETLTAWLQRLEHRVHDLDRKVKLGDDPPPKPPDLGP